MRGQGAHKDWGQVSMVASRMFEPQDAVRDLNCAYSRSAYWLASVQRIADCTPALRLVDDCATYKLMSECV